jgi:flagellar biosynthesis/type III secretory pathway M-ring protein FliF/YscJ
VDVNTKSTQEQSTTYDPKGTAKVETRIRSTTNEEETDAGTSAEPGVGANTQMSLAEAGGGGSKQSRSENDEETEFQAGLSKRETSTREGPGGVKVVAASVRVPHGYFVKMYKEQNPGAKDPDEATLAPYLERQLTKIREDVKSCTALSDDKAVAVETYADSMFAAATEGAAAEPVQAGVTAVVGGHGKEIALGALAVVSLFMMSMMVRKGTPAPVIGHVPEPQGPVVQLAAGEEVVGEAGDGETVLGGMELDEDAAQTQQMLGQVTDLVKENPDAAANLIKRWMNK